jgi:citrate/tricarballylate utilization protein
VADLDQEARRVLRLCNACRYCEGLCPVFPALERQRSFRDADLDHLANLCHGCGACHWACPFAPPHAFAVHLPQTLAALRWRSWQRQMVPGPVGGWLARRATWIGWVAAIAVSVFLLGLAATADPAAIFAVHSGPGAFYRLFSHEVLVTLFGLAFLWPVATIAFASWRFWRRIAAGLPRPTLDDWWQAWAAAASLRHLDGGGTGCAGQEDRPDRLRRLWHHLTFSVFCHAFLPPQWRRSGTMASGASPPTRGMMRRSSSAPSAASGPWSAHLGSCSRGAGVTARGLRASGPMPMMPSSASCWPWR